MSKKQTNLDSKINHFNNLIEKHEKNLAKNPFSSNWEVLKSNQSLLKLNKSDKDYGVPENKKTLMRGIQANEHIHKEIDELCQVIKENGQLDDNNEIFIEFGKLFEIYTKISNKLVGLLLRARKYDYLNFDGEILLQGKNDYTKIKLIKKL